MRSIFIVHIVQLLRKYIRKHFDALSNLVITMHINLKDWLYNMILRLVRLSKVTKYLCLIPAIKKIVLQDLLVRWTENIQKFRDFELFEQIISQSRKKFAKKHSKTTTAGKVTDATVVVSQPLRVTFVAGVGDMRVMRLAAAAQSAGIKTQLIIRQTRPYRDDMARCEFFDRVVWLEKWSWPWEIDTFQKNITEFGTDLVHCCLQLNTNALAAHLLATCPLPLVGDAYDMVTVQYHPQHDFAKKWYASQSVLEQLWYKNADGICFRSPYFGIMKHYNILPQKNCKITIIPEPLLEVACSRENNSVKNILLSPFSDNIEKELEMISEALNDTGINCYIIPMGITKNIKLDKRFTIIEQMPYKQYGHFLNTIDAYIQLPRSLLIYPARVKKENAYLIWRNNWSDVIERGVHLFVPEFFQYVFGYFRKTEIVHYFGKDELISHKFWSKRLIKILNCQNKPDLSRYNYINCGRKLKKFYESIVIRNN